MALATYDDLRSAVADWLARTDLTDRIVDFITLAEARINRELRCREMVTEAIGTTTVQDITIPTDFVETVKLVLDAATDEPLEYRPIEDAELRVAGSTTGQPVMFSVLGQYIRLYPSPDAEYTYTLNYYATVPSLSDSNTSNWLLTKAPDLYLFGALVEASPFLLDDGRVGLWEGKFQAAKRSLRAAEARAKRTSGPRRMRVVA